MLKDYIFSIFDFYKHIIEQQISALTCVIGGSVSSKIETKNTEFPICPWCGGDYQNYADFEFEDYQIICCKENSNRKFNVIRHASNNVTYSTHKIKPIIFKKENNENNT